MIKARTVRHDIYFAYSTVLHTLPPEQKCAFCPRIVYYRTYQRRQVGVRVLSMRVFSMRGHKLFGEPSSQTNNITFTISHSIFRNPVSPGMYQLWLGHVPDAPSQVLFGSRCVG